MMNLFKKTHNLVLMDGSSKECLCSIMVKLGDIIGKEVVTVSKVDNNHPTMILMEYKTGLRNNQKIKKELDRNYPGLCIYDVAV